MKYSSTFFLKIIICLIALGALAALIRFPQTEGRAANLDLLSIYTDPFIIYTYIASIPFFMALFQAITLLTLVEKNAIFSPAALRAVKNSKYCAQAIIGFVIGAEAFLLLAMRNTSDDSAGAVAMGIFITVISLCVVAGTTVLEKLLQKGAALQSRKSK